LRRIKSVLEITSGSTPTESSRTNTSGLRRNRCWKPRGRLPAAAADAGPGEITPSL
jgi:hypothetical protein